MTKARSKMGQDKERKRREGDGRGSVGREVEGREEGGEKEEREGFFLILLSNSVSNSTIY